MEHREIQLTAGGGQVTSHLPSAPFGHYDSLSVVVIGRGGRAGSEVGGQRSEEKLCPKRTLRY